MSYRSLVLVVLLALWPLSVRADEQPPSALEVGASVATCMARVRYAPDEEGVEVQGTVHEVTLIEQARPFVVLHRRDFDPAKEPWLANQTFQPPMAFDVVGKNDEGYRRETLRYAYDCFNRVMYP
jgi:hypothetical protein